MIPHDKKTLVWKQYETYEYWLFKVLCLSYEQGLRMSTASRGRQNRNNSPSWCYFMSSLLKNFNICIIRSENNFKNACVRVFSERIIHTTIVFFMDEFLCNIEARNQQITTKYITVVLVHQ